MTPRNNNVTLRFTEQTMRAPTIAASAVRALLDFAVSKGASRATLLRRSALDTTELSARDNRVAFGKYIALMHAGKDLCSDPALALHFGEAVDVSEISIACSVGAMENIDQAFAQLNRYASLGVDVESAGNGDRYHVRRCSGQLWVVDQRRNPNEFPELTESSFARMVCSTRRSFPTAKFFKELHFSHAAPSYRAEYERIFGVPILFDSSENAMRLDEALIAKVRVRRRSQYVTGVLKDHAELMLRNLENGKSTKDRVEKILIARLTDGVVSMESVGRELGLSRQTLFRRLRDEGVTFEQVLAQLRCSLARHYLNDRKVSVKETAYLLGFSDPTAFSRAFKRWTGERPQRVRVARGP